MSSRTQKDADSAAARPRRRLWLFLPLIVFAALAAIFYFRLFTGDPSRIPSALIGRQVPAFDLPPLEGLKSGGEQVPGFASADLAKGEVSLVNVWASWCAPCRLEHPILMEAAQAGIARIYGLNYKDQPENARRFLGQLGNPYAAVGADRNGRVGIDWGVYGVPETFVVDGKGHIVYKHVGPIDRTIMRETILPRIGEAAARN